MGRARSRRSFAARAPFRRSARATSRAFSVVAYLSAIRVGAAMAAEQDTPEQRTAPSGPEDAAVSRDPGTPDTAPDDANDLQGFHFRRLMSRRSTWLWGGIPTAVAAIALAFGNPLWIPIVLVLGLLITVIVCWIKANSQAEDDFFRAYAEERGLTRTE